MFVHPHTQCRLDYLVVSPHVAPDKHARYMMKKLLSGTSARMMMLFHNYKGATKALAVLATATKMLQRKHSSTLLCRVGFTIHDPLRMRLLAKLWPYAGVLHPSPDAAADARVASSSSNAHVQDVAPQVKFILGSSVSDTEHMLSSSGGKGSSEAQGDASSREHAGVSLMQQCLEGRVPLQPELKNTIRHLPPVAIPVQVSRHHTFTCSRTTDSKRLARTIAASLSMKGRCRIVTAGGIAVLNALTAVAMVEYLLRKSENSRSLAMHVRARKRVEQQVPGSSDWPHVVMFYELTLLVAEADEDGVPATCVFRPRGRKSGQQQQQLSSSSNTGKEGKDSITVV